MRDFKHLRVWRQAHRLSLAVNEYFAVARRRGFTHIARQAQRSASSVPSNIVEGCGHDSPREFARYLRTAIASANELEYHLIEARDLELLCLDRFDLFTEEVGEVRRKLVVLRERVRRDDI
jgi:four helix bundle protein